MKRNLFFMAMLLLVGGVFAFTQVKTWKIGKDYNVDFSAKGVNGIFQKLSGTVNFDEAKLSESKLVFTIDVNSINTGNGLQNKHALGAEWFNADKYPNIKFTSSSIEKKDGSYAAKGKLTVKDVTKDITIPFSFTKSGSKAKITSSFSIDRGTYNVGKAGGDVGNSIKINVTIPVTK
ncbi:MAG: YceI family protein [Fluviicola sp.]